MNPVTTTLNELRRHTPCFKGWKKLLKHLGKTQADDEPLPLMELLYSNGFRDTLWALRTRPDLRHLWRLFALDCADRVRHVLTHPSSKKALDVARCHAHGWATKAELKEAWSTAQIATRDTREEASFIGDEESMALACAIDAVSWATISTADGERNVPAHAAWVAARAAAWDAITDIHTNSADEIEAKWAGARKEEQLWQSARLCQLLKAGVYVNFDWGPESYDSK